MGDRDRCVEETERWRRVTGMSCESMSREEMYGMNTRVNEERMRGGG